MRKRAIVGTLLVLLLAAATVAVILRDHPPHELLAALARLRRGYLVGGVLMMGAFVSCEALSTRMLLRALGNRASLRACLGYAFAGFYFSSVTPLSAGGQPMQVFYMSRDGIPAAHGTLVMLLDSIFYQVVTVLYAVAAILFYPRLVKQLGMGMRALLVIGGGALTLSAVVFLAFLFRPALAARLSDGILIALHKLRLVRDLNGRRNKLERQMEEYRAGAELLGHRPLLLPAMLGINTMQLTFLYLIPMVVYRAFGLTGAHAAEMAATQALLSLAVVCLPLPGAVGAAEAAFLRGFAIFFGGALVTPAVIAVRSINFYLFLLISGAITAAVHLHGRRRGRASALG